MNVKGLVKKVALVLAGITALTAVCFGVKAIVDYTNEDLKTISPSFSVGNLGSDGKYVEDEGALYTKEAFACYGLQIKPEFDSQLEYQIYYYDILDTYISCTDVLTVSYCEEAPLNGAYARIVIIPTDDDDGKISLLERVTYANDINIKVYKEQDLNDRFDILSGKVLQRSNNLTELVFEKTLYLDESTLEWALGYNEYVTTSTYLSVKGGSILTGSFDAISCEVNSFIVYEFGGLSLYDNYLSYTVCDSSNSFSVTLNSKTKYVVISAYASSTAWLDSDLTRLPSCFTLTK